MMIMVLTFDVDINIWNDINVANYVMMIHCSW